jgi:uncharacterized protein
MTSAEPGPEYPQKPEGTPAGAYQPQQPYGQQPYAQPQHPQQQYPQQQYPGQAPYAQPGGGVAQPLRPDEERTWSIVGHLLPLIGLSFLAPLVVWLVFRGRGPYLEDQAKESLNFQLTLLIGYLIGAVTTIILIGFLILPLLGLAQLILSIMAAIACSKYEWYRYPLTIRFVK